MRSEESNADYEAFVHTHGRFIRTLATVSNIELNRATFPAMSIRSTDDIGYWASSDQYRHISLNYGYDALFQVWSTERQTAVQCMTIHAAGLLSRNIDIMKQKIAARSLTGAPKIKKGMRMPRENTARSIVEEVRQRFHRCNIFSLLL